MRATAFFHRHYLVAGESVTTHAAAVLVGGLMTVIGVALIATVAFLPVGVVIAFLGLLILGVGVFAHIQRPVKFADMADSVMALAGAAIALTFVLAMALFLIAFVASVVGSLVGWFRGGF